MKSFTVCSWERDNLCQEQQKMKGAFTRLPRLGSVWRRSEPWVAARPAVAAAPGSHKSRDRRKASPLLTHLSDGDAIGEPWGQLQSSWWVSASSSVLHKENYRSRRSLELVCLICRIPPCTLNSLEQTKHSSWLLKMPSPSQRPVWTGEELQKLAETS